MKKLLWIFALSTLLFANSINIKAGSKVSHIAQGEWNEDNKLIGIEYQHNDNFIVEYSEFVNSYGKDTKFAMFTGQYLPLNYNKFNFGAGLSAGYQDGYCHKDWQTRQCKNGMDDTSLIVLPFLTAEFDNFIIRYTYIPNAVEIMTFGFKAIEW
jgi:hypothetical protein